MGILLGFFLLLWIAGMLAFCAGVVVLAIWATVRLVRALL